MPEALGGTGPSSADTRARSGIVAGPAPPGRPLISLGTAALAAALAASPASSQTSAGSGPVFTEITAEAGLDFVHDPGARGEYFFPEILGSGAALFDHDGDGDLDIYFIQAGSHDLDAENEKPNRLFRQTAPGRFEDATEESGLGDLGYGVGVAVGDVDDDGLPDVFVSNFGPDALYRNLGRGRFENATAAAGLDGDGWSTSAAFCDYDLDGRLDLYVAHYLVYDPARPVPFSRYGALVDPIQCRSEQDGTEDYCSPNVFAPEPDRLYRNEGDGRFRDVSQVSGIQARRGPGLGVVCQDLTGDGRPDFYVANDQTENFLWENQGDGTFVDRALESGTALSGEGKAEAGMGIALGDADGDERLDLFLTHLMEETNTLYRNEGEGRFRDATDEAGLGLPGLATTGFGVAFLDYDHDGDLDLAIANGRVARSRDPRPSRVDAFWRPYAEPNLLLRNDGGGRLRFSDASAEAGAFAANEDVEVSRGMAVGDVEGDGDLDLLVTQIAGPARLYRNDAPKAGRWLLVRALGPGGKRDVPGALVLVEWRGRRYVRPAQAAVGYLSSSDPRAHFGLPAGGALDGDELAQVSVRWPDGREESFGGHAPDQSLTFEKGKGNPAP